MGEEYMCQKTRKVNFAKKESSQLQKKRRGLLIQWFKNCKKEEATIGQEQLPYLELSYLESLNAMESKCNLNKNVPLKW